MDFYTVAFLQGLGYAAMGLGIFISLKIFNIPDITTDGSYTLGGVITAVGLMSGMHPLITLLLAVAGGACAGIATGMIHVRLGVNALLSGILVMTALYSVNLMIMGRSNLPLTDATTVFGGALISENPMLNRFIILSLITIACSLFLLWLLRTDIGIFMRATGDNEQMVRANGMDTGKMKIAGLALANALTALSGYLLVQYQGFADINMGIGIVISGLAAVMIGEALASLFRNNSLTLIIMAVIAGSILFRLSLAVALSFGLNPNYLKLTTALIVLGILSFTKFRSIKT
jgi:putative ABC transport system permease protein